MRLIRWIIILFILLLGIMWAYQHLTAPPPEDETACIEQRGQWNPVSKSCAPETSQQCIAKGYEWDEEGNRCLITDYRL